MNDTNESLPLAAIETSQLSSITGGITRCRPQPPTHRGPSNPWGSWGSWGGWGGWGIPQPRPTPCQGPRPGFGAGPGFGFGGGRYYSRSR